MQIFEPFLTSTVGNQTPEEDVLTAAFKVVKGKALKQLRVSTAFAQPVLLTMVL